RQDKVTRAAQLRQGPQSSRIAVSTSQTCISRRDIVHRLYQVGVQLAEHVSDLCIKRAKNSVRIFVTGASGYIGGSIAAALISAGHSVVGLVRQADKASQLALKGIQPLLGTLADLAEMTEAARAADAVINTANADDFLAADTLIQALAGSGKVLIHTSGTSVVADRAAGEYSAAIFHEDSPFDPLPERLLRVAIDRAVLMAAQQKIRSVVIRPSLIYGRGHGLNPHSIQLPRLI